MADMVEDWRTSRVDLTGWEHSSLVWKLAHRKNGNGSGPLTFDNTTS